MEHLKELDGSKAVIVLGGDSMKRLGFLDKIQSYLKKASIEFKLIERIEPDPSVDIVMKGAKIMREYEPDCIIAVGVGSPIDAAKAMWVFYEYPDFTFEKAVIPFGIPKLRQKAKFIAIPSTSGTATEIKYPMSDFNLTPDVAIIDPALAQTMPKKLVAYTGMDTLTHAMEAYVASLCSDFSDSLALHAINMIHKYLLKSYKGNTKARGHMYIAQCLAGMAFSNALLGITHSMAHKTGAVFHIPHVYANAIFLPYVIDFK